MAKFTLGGTGVGPGNRICGGYNMKKFLLEILLWADLSGI
jgi:hypothetical protein